MRNEEVFGQFRSMREEKQWELREFEDLYRKMTEGERVAAMDSMLRSCERFVNHLMETSPAMLLMVSHPNLGSSTYFKGSFENICEMVLNKKYVINFKPELCFLSVGTNFIPRHFVVTGTFNLDDLKNRISKGTIGDFYQSLVMSSKDQLENSVIYHFNMVDKSIERNVEMVDLYFEEDHQMSEISGSGSIWNKPVPSWFSGPSIAYAAHSTYVSNIFDNRFGTSLDDLEFSNRRQKEYESIIHKQIHSFTQVDYLALDGPNGKTVWVPSTEIFPPRPRRSTPRPDQMLVSGSMAGVLQNGLREHVRIVEDVEDTIREFLHHRGGYGATPFEKMLDQKKDQIAERMLKRVDKIAGESGE